MRNIHQIYKEVFAGEHKVFADKNHKDMNATNIELWRQSRYIFYIFAIIGNIASFAGCTYGIHLYLADSMPDLISWAIGFIFAAGLEITFVFAYQYAAIKIFQGYFKYAVPYMFIASFYVLVYFPTTYGFESFVIRTDKSIAQLNTKYSKDSIATAQSYDSQIDSLNRRILNLETERQSISYFADITRNNELQRDINRYKNDLLTKKENRLNELAATLQINVDKANSGLLQNSSRHLNLAIIILLYVFVMYTAISIIRYFADEEYRKFYAVAEGTVMLEKKKSIPPPTLKLIKGGTKINGVGGLN